MPASRPPASGLADDHELGQTAVLRREAHHLVLDAARLRVGAEDVVELVRRVAAGFRLLDRCGAHGVVGGDPLGDLRLADVRARNDLLEVEPVVASLRRLPVEQVDEDRLRTVDRGLVARMAHVDAEAVQRARTLLADRDLVHLQAVRRLGGRTQRQRRKQDGDGRYTKPSR
jgi:hypothetical protein